jgi:hypothetical protein
MLEQQAPLACTAQWFDSELFIFEVPGDAIVLSGVCISPARCSVWHLLMHL